MKGTRIPQIQEMLITDMKEPRPGAENDGEKANIRRLARTWEEFNQGEQRKL